MSTGYRKSRVSNPADSPSWVLLSGVLALALSLVALPAILIGVFAQRFTRRTTWSTPFWFLLLIPGVALSAYFYLHGLQDMVVKELTDYILTIKHSQADVTRWDLRALWSETWPVWLQTLVATPLVGFWQEVSDNARGGQTSRFLRQKELRRQRQVQRSQHQAKKRTSRPGRVADAVAGMMVIGVPIKDEQEGGE